MPSIPMKSNINQNNANNDYVITEKGCAVCCATDVASSYGNVNLTLAQMRDTYNVYDSDVNNYQGAIMGNVPYADIDNITTSCNESTCLSKIKSEIDNGRLILVYMEGKLNNGKQTTHYTVAYGYWSDASHTNHISVFDPYTGSSTGKLHILCKVRIGQIEIISEAVESKSVLTARHIVTLKRQSVNGKRCY